MTPESQKPPYVVSSDVNIVMQHWSKESGYKVPEPSFFRDYSEQLRQFLKEIFQTQIDIVGEVELKDGMNTLALSSKYPLISMDRIYLNEGLPNFEKYFDATRAVTENLKRHEDELSPREGALSIKKQLDMLAEDVETPVTFVDDVLFSGNGFILIYKELKKRNRPIKEAVFGIGVGEGLKKARDLGVDVRCVREYTEVIDEICERDFLGGIPFSGRTLICPEGNYFGAPYFLPFGDPCDWASIPPDKTADYSKFCLSQSIKLWKEIEKLSEIKIATAKIPRKIFHLQDNDSITSALERIAF